MKAIFVAIRGHIAGENGGVRFLNTSLLFLFFTVLQFVSKIRQRFIKLETVSLPLNTKTW